MDTALKLLSNIPYPWLPPTSNHQFYQKHQNLLCTNHEYRRTKAWTFFMVGYVLGRPFGLEAWGAFLGPASYYVYSYYTAYKNRQLFDLEFRSGLRVFSSPTIVRTHHNPSSKATESGYPFKAVNPDTLDLRGIESMVQSLPQNYFS